MVIDFDKKKSSLKLRKHRSLVMYKISNSIKINYFNFFFNLNHNWLWFWVGRTDITE